MLILVSVTISMAINGGLFEKAGDAVGDTQNAINKEQELASGKITIGDREYSTIGGYVSQITGNIWPIEWNSLDVMGNTGITIDGQKFVKVSDYIPTKEELENGFVTATYGEESITVNYLESAEYGNIQIAVFTMDENELFLIIATEKGYNEELGIEITEMGLYAMDFGGYGADMDLALNTSKAVAILVEDGTFYFTNMDEEQIGDTYHNSPIIAYYRGFEHTNYGIDNESNFIYPEWITDENYKKVKKVIVEDAISPISTALWFIEMSNCIEIDLSALQTNKVNNMLGMFAGCENLQTIKFGKGWDTSNVEIIAAMFSGCDSLTELDLSNWNTSKVTNMGETFSSCDGLTSLKISTWDTSNVTYMGEMFNGCKQLAELNVAKWNVSKTESFIGLFSGCSKLIELDLSGWVTSSVSDMTLMFWGCNSLEKILLGEGWTTSNVTLMSDMFNGCQNLTLDCSKWDVSKVNYVEYFNENAPGVILPQAWQTTE